MISIKNLSRNYGSLLAVDDLTLEIERGEIVGLLGHNGAGKTTAMKVITGFLEPTSGSVQVGGIDVGTHRRGVQRLIGYLPENAPLYPEMLVQEYLRTMAELRGLPVGEIDRAVASAAAATALERHMLAPIHTLSKGYRQRVGLAQAILHEPEVLVLDEPTNGLDPLQIQAIRELIRRLARRTTIILSTHILQEIEAVCDRVLVMIQGRLVADSSLRGLLEGNEIGLDLASDGLDEAAVTRQLEAVAGIRSARRRGADRASGLEQWALEYEAGTRPIPDLIEAVRAAGWTIASVAPRRRTLESVFQQLQEEHVARLRASAADPGSAAAGEGAAAGQSAAAGVSAAARESAAAEQSAATGKRRL